MFKIRFGRGGVSVLIDPDLINILELDTLAVPGYLGYAWDITDNLNYWYKAGTNGILLVAHLDTITRCNSPRNKKPRPFNLCESNGLLFAENSVLGADDRAGVYAIKKILESVPECSVLFTNFEEAGGIGVKTFIKDHPMALLEHTLFIEIDRRGIDQFTHYMPDIDPNLEDIANTFNFNYEIGSYSDVSDLSKHYKIPHINLSAGYYNEHSAKEYLDYKTLYEVLTPRYINFIQATMNQPFKYYLDPPNLFNYYDSSHDWGDYTNPYTIDLHELELLILEGFATDEEKEAYSVRTGMPLDLIESL